MPSFDQHHQGEPAKILLIGDPGGGKTGALAALANAGYRIVVADFDNKLSVLTDYLAPGAAQRVFYETFTDKITIENGVMKVAGTPKAFSDAMNAFDRWRFPERKFTLPDGKEISYPAYDLKGTYDWGRDTILVIDSLTQMSYACMYFSLGIAEANTQNWLEWYPGDYKRAQHRMEGLLQRIKSKQMRCHVIVIAHLRYMGGGGVQVQQDQTSGTEVRRELDSREEGQAYPFALGRQLPPMIPSFFNGVLQVKQVFGKPKLITKTQDNLNLLNPAPERVPIEIPIVGGDPKTGLARYFQIVYGDPPTKWREQADEPA